MIAMIMLGEGVGLHRNRGNEKKAKLQFQNTPLVPGIANKDLLDLARLLRSAIQHSTLLIRYQNLMSSLFV